MYPPNIQRADPRLRKQALLWILAILVAGLLALRYIALRPTPETLPLWIGGSVGLSAVVIAAFAVYLWRLGVRIKASLRFPPPGLRVIRDTVIMDGADARRRGILLQVLAVVLLLWVLAFLAVTWRLLAVLGASTA